MGRQLSLHSETQRLTESQMPSVPIIVLLVFMEYPWRIMTLYIYVELNSCKTLHGLFMISLVLKILLGTEWEALFPCAL